MTKTQLIEEIAENAKLTKAQATRAVAALVDTVRRTVFLGENVKINGFGVFESIKFRGRIAHHVLTGKMFKIPSGRKVKFKVSRVFKQAMNAKGL